PAQGTARDLRDRGRRWAGRVRGLGVAYRAHGQLRPRSLRDHPARRAARAARMIRRRGTAAGVAMCLVAGAGIAAGSAAPVAAHSITAQRQEIVWLCRPGLPQTPCESDLTATVAQADGSQKMQAAAPAKNPPVDCFYVYPTVSAQPTVNANLNVDPEL